MNANAILASSALLFALGQGAMGLPGRPAEAEAQASRAPTSSTAINPGVAWPAVDALGRQVPTIEEVGPLRADRFVGMFYFLWHNNQGGKSPHWDGRYDIARIKAQDPEALKRPDSPLWGPIGMYHYWGEPLYGYYLSTDPWVLRRHAHLLADAGVDTPKSARKYPANDAVGFSRAGERRPGGLRARQ